MLTSLFTPLAQLLITYVSQNPTTMDAIHAHTNVFNKRKEFD